MKLLYDQYSQALPVPLSEFERAQIFRRVEAALETRRAAPRLPTFAWAATALALAASGTFAYRAVRAHEPQPAVITAPVVTQETLELPDGSRAIIGPASQMRVDAAEPLRVRLSLLEGRVDLSVTEVEGRSFVVSAGNVDVNVLGGRVSVAVEPPDSLPQGWAIEVRASDGRADVHRKSGGPPVVLEAGETWSSRAATNSVEAEPFLPAER
ncbi:MAG TPA: FecR family protein [Polyangiaceae bacterium]|nr:FecR family protein [Polyangiaceae bacterium]